MSTSDPFSKSKKLPRSPTRNTNLQQSSTEESSCKACTAPDSAGNMVQCDKCNHWYHFACVGVDSFIVEEDWFCHKCRTDLETPAFNGDIGNSLAAPIIPLGTTVEAPVTSKQNSKASKSSKTSKSSSQRQLQIELQKLEEERNMTERREEEERERKQKRDQEYINKKYKILSQIAEESSSSEDENQSVAQVRVDNWLEDARNSVEDCPHSSKVTGASLRNTVQRLGARDQNVNKKWLGAVVRQQQPQQLPPLQPASSSFANPNQAMFCPAVPREQARRTETPFVERQQNASEHYYSQHNQVPFQQPLFVPATLPPTATIGSGNNHITRSQFAARHSMRDLQSFGGNPDEWPLFISSFERTTKLCGFSDEENLFRLQRALHGKALDAVRSLLIQPGCVSEVIGTLKMLFGRPEFIINSLLHKIQLTPSPKAEQLDSIITYALEVQNLCAIMEASGLTAHLCNPTLLQELVDKLPPTIRLNWGIYNQTLSECTLSHFKTWLYQIAEAANRVLLPKASIHGVESKTVNRITKDKGFLNAHSTEVSVNKHVTRQTKCCICGGTCKAVEECSKFARASRTAKWAAVREHQLCRRCLKKHGYRCESETVCGKNNCIFKHHRLLHNDEKEGKEILQKIGTVSLPSQHNCNAHSHDSESVMFRILPVILYGKNIQISTFAFLDEGSSLTLVDEEIATMLKIKGTPHPLCLKWTGNTHRYENDSKLINFQISSTRCDAQKFFLSNVHTVENLQLPKQSLDAKELQSKFEHLRGLPIESYKNAAPRLLIGLNNSKLGIPLKCKEGSCEEPVAAKTRLGWTVHGVCSGLLRASEDEATYHTFHSCECEESSKNNFELERLVKAFLCTDTLEVANHRNTLVPPEEKRAQELLNTYTCRKNGRFETGLLWKFDDVQLPDSLPMAKRRLLCLQKRMCKDQSLADVLNKKIKEYVAKGYARKLSQKELRDRQHRVWYLPIFPVQNPNKPGKIRIVWDAAAKVQGVSLNSVLLKGPDQLASLISVIYKFREYRIAICADIMEMFHQVLIREDDQHFQRFLWGGDSTIEPDVYAMRVMTFGATCSPCCAQFVKNKNADAFLKDFPRAVQSIRENHYVDDLMDSVETEEAAIKLATEIREIHQEGGFYIRNWISNSTAVLKALQSDPIDKMNLNIEAEICPEKVLGMWWCTSSDSFVFKISSNAKQNEILYGSIFPTKRQLLRTLMTIFDPLGLLANYLMYLKILLQEIWRTGIDWDERIKEEQYRKWLNWVRLLPEVESLKIPRCYNNTDFNEPSEKELHVFVDASENGYAAVAYIRYSFNNLVECALIGAKTRVAPLKLLSIPRLELQAAVLGARLAKNIVASHSIKFQRRMFWSDSKNVLCWLRSDHRKYRQFVAFRVSEILDLTELTEWQWVPSKLNVADEATKWQKNPEFRNSSRWFKGPEFLYSTSNKWPREAEIDEPTTEEIRTQFIGTHLQHREEVFNLENFSNWKRLLRSTAFVLRFLRNIQSVRKGITKTSGYLTQDELQSAENVLITEVQGHMYRDEIADLSVNRNVEKSSTIFKLCPYLDTKGILRAGGRLQFSAVLSEDQKSPIILPKNHPLTKLIILDFHCRYKHQNHETVINELRQRFSIPSMRAALGAVRKSCQKCKNFKATPQPPIMAQLPPARLASFCRAFSFVGVDYFGPMHVVILRRTEKRWGVLFTCLTTRAVHIEIAHTLSTDSCILAIRNFIVRRGTPIELYSDNGSNFQGAERELREAMRLVDFNKITETFTTTITKWQFIPPASPHMGGSWERLVRSVKTVLYQIMPTKKPSDELLRSMLLEVENIVNSRPLTYIPVDGESEEALTPNHFLLGSSNGMKSTITFDDDKMVLKRNWLTSQQYAESFWKRWVNEYLPTITRRTKWFTPVKPIEIGDIVLIVDPNSPRNVWPKGRVIKTKLSKDGQVRSAFVQTQTSIYERPAVKLAILDVRCSRELGPQVDLPGGSVSTPARIESQQTKP